MILSLNKNSLFSTFGVDSFSDLDQAVSGMSPSMVEYYLSDLSSDNESIYLNKRNIQDTISVAEYFLYLDYDEKVYLEINDSNIVDEYETPSLW